MRREETDSFYTLGARFSITEACGDGLTQFGAVAHYDVGAFASEGNARCAAPLDINQEDIRRPLHQRLLKSPSRFRHNVDIDPHKTTHDVLEFAFAEIACSPKARQCAAIKSQSRARLFDRLRSRHLSKMHH